MSEYCVWFDMTSANTQVNRGEAVKRAVEAGEASVRTLGDIAGLDETERMDTNERIRRIGEKMGDPYMALYGLEGVPDEILERAKEIKTSKPGPSGNVTDPSRPSEREDPATGSPEDDRSDRPGRSAPVD
jgi:hypothetical protein